MSLPFCHRTFMLRTVRTLVVASLFPSPDTARDGDDRSIPFNHTAEKRSRHRGVVGISPRCRCFPSAEALCRHHELLSRSPPAQIRTGCLKGELKQNPSKVEAKSKQNPSKTSIPSPFLPPPLFSPWVPLFTPPPIIPLPAVAVIVVAVVVVVAVAVVIVVAVVVATQEG